MLPVTRPAFKLVPPAAAPKPPTTDSHVLESHIGDGPEPALLAAALSAADSLLAGLAGGGLDLPEDDDAAATEEGDATGDAEEEALATITATSAAAPPVVPAPPPVEAPVARKVPQLAAVRKPFAAPAAKSMPPKPVDASGGGSDDEDEEQTEVKRPSAYVLFCSSRRGDLKAESPELSFGDLGKKLGAEWKVLSAEQKAPFFEKAQAAAASHMMGKESSAPSIVPKKRKTSSNDTMSVKKGKTRAAAVGDEDADSSLKPRTVTGWNVFCSERRPALAAERPELSFGDLAKTLGSEWKVLSEEERGPFTARAAQLTAEAPPRVAKAVKASKPAKPAMKLKPVAEDESTDVLLDKDKASASARVDDSNWSTDVSMPVQFLLSPLNDGLFACFCEPGAAPRAEEPAASRVAPGGNAQDGAGDSELMHTEEQEHDLAISIAHFKAALSERTNHKKEIDLEELGPDSPLCSMLVLEALRAKGGPLHTDAIKGGKNLFLGGLPDTIIKIPAVGLSFIVERLVRGAVESRGQQRRTAPPAAAPQLGAPAAVQDKARSVQPLLACSAMEE